MLSQYLVVNFTVTLLRIDKNWQVVNFDNIKRSLSTIISADYIVHLSL